MANFPNNPGTTDLVIFGIVRGGALIGVQTNAYDIALDGTDPGAGSYSFENFSLGGIPMNAFLGVVQNPAGAGGSAAQRRQIKIHAIWDAITLGAALTQLLNGFTSGASMTGVLRQPNGSLVAGSLVIHLRAVSSINYLSLPGGNTAPSQIAEAANLLTTGGVGTVTASGPAGWVVTKPAVSGGTQLHVQSPAVLGADTQFSLNFPTTVAGQLSTSQFAGGSIALWGATTTPAANSPDDVQPIVYADASKPAVLIKQTAAALPNTFPYQLTIGQSTTNDTVAFSYYVQIDDLIKAGVPGHIDVQATILHFTFKLRHKHSGATSVSVTRAAAGGWAIVGALPSGVTHASVGTTPGATAFASTTSIGGSFNVPGSVESVSLQVEAYDRRGNQAEVAAGVMPSVFSIIAIPTKIALVLDYSGSMRQSSGSGSKWEATVGAAKLFNTVYGALKPTANDQLAVVEFWASGGSNHTSLTALTDAATTLAITNDGSDPPGVNRTPIGAGIVRARDELQVAGGDASWRNRILLVLTDGIENEAPYLDDVRDPSNASHATSWGDAGADAERTGFQMHAIAFGGAGEISTGELAQLVSTYDGDLFSSESGADPNDHNQLEEIFVNLLAASLPVEQVAPVSGNYTIENGVEKAVFFRTGTGTFTVNPGGHTSTATNQISIVSIANPTAGAYTVSGGSGTTFAVVDLQLRARFRAERSSTLVGAPIELTAVIEENGVGVSGATVEVEVRRPGESLGEVLTTFLLLPQAAYTQVLLPGHADPVTIQALRAAGGLPGGVVLARQAVAVAAPINEPVALRAQLLRAAEAQRGYPFRIATNGVLLHESIVQRGKYVATFTDTAEEGTYTFRFTARGKSHQGQPFSRTFTVSSYTGTGVSGKHSKVHWRAQPIAGTTNVNYIGTLTLLSNSGRPLGPGVASQLSVSALSQKDPTPLPVVDLLNGTYTVSLVLPAGSSPPQLLVGLKGQPSSAAVLVTPGALPGAEQRCHHVRIVLDKIVVKNAHEPWFKGAGELVFRAFAAPNLDPDRTVLARVPRSGHLSLKDGQGIELREVLFDGHLLDGESLQLVLSGTELDGWFDADDKLRRYQRRFEGPISAWAGSYRPDDEPQDPESLSDWQLWYTVVVD